MKRIWKAVLAAGLMSLAICLFAGMPVFAEKVSGGVIEGITWEVDTETDTLTLTGEGLLPSELFLEIEEGKYWGEYDGKIHHVVINGNIEPYINDPTLGKNEFYTTSGTVGTISWKYDFKASVLTISGTGVVTTHLWDFYGHPDLDEGNRLKKLIFADGITDINFGGDLYRYRAETIQIGKTFQNLEEVREAGREIIVDPEHPDWASYEGCLYTKDFSTLLCCPCLQTNPQFHPNIKIVGQYAFGNSRSGRGGGALSVAVLPWGVTTISDDAFTSLYGGNIVLPDTITYMTEKALPRAMISGGTFTYNKDNQLIAPIFLNSRNPQWTGNPVDSLAQYYPNVPEAQGPGPSSSPTESKPESSAPASQPESKPESSAPASSTPASQPASKPAENAASSQPPESSASESSAPSSEPESSVAPAEKPSTEESSIAESSQEESAAESSGESSASTESEETSGPEGLPTVERKIGGTMLVVLAVVLAAAGGAGIAVLVLKKGKK